ncbi:Asp/Glu/hydantoin racemase [Trametes elegans]|nr:Asp/Glu/hydantoin racemase [Trametes elegans]
MAKTVSILILNPNSSKSMTAALEPILADLQHPGLALHFHTGTAELSPPSVDDWTTSVLSAAHTFETLRPLFQDSQDGTREYDAYLVACFSDHPLVEMLREQTTKPVLGIFEASVMQALALGQPFGIVTTGRYWERALTAGVRRVFGSADMNGIFVGVQSTGMTARELHEKDQGIVAEGITAATSTLVARGARTIIMGCAGMSGMEEAVRRGDNGVLIRVVDAVRGGVTALEGLCRAQA